MGENGTSIRGGTFVSVIIYYWWYSVASSEITKTVIGDKGTEKTFQINFATNKVRVL